MAPAKSKLTQKELSLISDILTYEQWAMKKSQMYSGMFAETVLKDLSRNLETTHSKNYTDLFNYLNAQ